MLLAIGMTLVIATGGVDLSVGAVMAISASVAALLINPDLQSLSNDPNVTATPLPVVLIATLVVATVCGLWNGALVAYGGIQPMVATLILMIAGRGIAQLITNGVRIQIFYEPYAFLGNGWIILPFSLFIVAAVFVVAWLMTRRTALGMFIESVGINSRSSFFSGINERRVKLVAYMFCGFCAGMAGLVASSSIRTSDANNIGLNFELDAILAVVIGGTALGAGGRFSLFASIIGAIVMQAITTSMYAIGVPAHALLAVKGVVVVLVILLLSVQVREFVRRVAAPKAA
jgi:simple sugar transport system permease protein